MFKRFIKPVYAHCDVPCGIYETDTMRHAADTVKSMVERYEEIGKLDPADPEAMNKAVRAVATKEEHAQRCKDQLYILWSDYFKPEHIEKIPNFHDIFWQATRQCSKVKRTMSIKESDKLIEMIHEISHIFQDTKK